MRGTRVVRDSRGQGLIEYVILVAMVGVATIGMVRILQKSIKVDLAEVVHALQSDDKRHEAHERISEEDVRKSDFSNFMNGAAGHGRR